MFFMVIILVLIFAFIFMGVTAFTIPGSFGSIINSLFPIGIIFAFNYLFLNYYYFKFNKVY